MTYWQFMQLGYTADRLKAWRDVTDAGFAASFGTPFIRYYSVRENDTCCNMDLKKSTTRYYLGLPGYKLGENIFFHARYGHYYLSCPVWTKFLPQGGKSGPTIVKEVPFRYSYTNFNERYSDRAGTVLVPVSASVYHILYYIVWGLQILIIFIRLYVFIVAPGKVLIRIARGKPFTKENIRQLNEMAWVVLGGLVLFSLLRYLLAWIFRAYLVPELHLQFFELFTQEWVLTVVCLFIIAKAFKRGYDLQKEQDLTI